MKHVLLLDDDPVQLAVRQLLLRRGGIESQISTQADEALELLRSESGQAIGAVITDHLMPSMDGAEFVRRLRSFDPWIPVVVVSGLPDAETMYEGLNVQFLSKPCEPEDLIAVIKSSLDDRTDRASA